MTGSLFLESEIPPGHAKGKRRVVRGAVRFYKVALTGAAKREAAKAYMPTVDGWVLDCASRFSPVPADRLAYREALLRIISGEDIAWPDEPAPWSTRRLIPKTVIQDRLEAQGKLGAAMALLQSSPLDFAKWFVGSAPNVYADDDRMLEVLAALDADIEAITAP